MVKQTLSWVSLLVGNAGFSQCGCHWTAEEGGGGADSLEAGAEQSCGAELTLKLRNAAGKDKPVAGSLLPTAPPEGEEAAEPGVFTVNNEPFHLQARFLITEGQETTSLQLSEMELVLHWM